MLRLDLPPFARLFRFMVLIIFITNLLTPLPGKRKNPQPFGC
jgi:hypothetical protein